MPQFEIENIKTSEEEDENIKKLRDQINLVNNKGSNYLSSNNLTINKNLRSGIKSQVIQEKDKVKF
jgi:hypothetical protein